MHFNRDFLETTSWKPVNTTQNLKKLFLKLVFRYSLPVELGLKPSGEIVHFYQSPSPY